MGQMRDVLRKLRSEREEKQSTVADALLISRGTYSSYENGITPPTEVCIKLADYFDVSLEYLLGLSNERKPAGGRLAAAFSSLAKLAGDAAPTANDMAGLLEAAARYYQKGACCGDLPLHALKGFHVGLCAALAAAVQEDSPALLDSVNAAAVAALDITKMPAVFYESKQGGTNL